MWTLVILQESFLYQKSKMQIKLNLKDYCFLKNKYKTIFCSVFFFLVTLKNSNTTLLREIFFYMKII